MKKRLIIIIVACLTAVIAASIVIGVIISNGGGKKAYTVYSAPNTVKVMRSEDYADKGGATLDFAMAKNEYESAQIIVNSQQDTTFNAVIEKDLVSKEGNRIFKSNVSVYAQHYVECTVPTGSFDPGFYPDALVPMQNYLAKRHNVIGKGNNQGITVIVKTEANTPSGVYEGQLKLVVGQTYEYIPINVTVWNFTLSNETHNKTAFTIWENQIFAYELDGSEEMLKTYYEFFLDRRVTSSYLPTQAADNVDEYVNVVKEYTQREDVPCFRIYYRTVYSNELKGWILDLAHFEELLRAFIENSTSELNLMKKPYMYCSSVDEPNSTNAYNRVKYINDNMYRIIGELANEYSASGWFDDKPEVLESLLNFQNVVTTRYRAEIADYVDTWCPTVDWYNDEMYWQNSLAQKQNGHGTWWYTCIQPENPQPSSHIDDNLVSSRAMSWMQKKYDVEGNLYWATTIYQKYTRNGYVHRDLWNDPLSWAANNPTNGDGFLVYPGKEYGIKGPISTLRLESIREGMEDYEYLYMLEQLLNERTAKYGVNVELNEYVGDLYDMIFNGTIASTNVKNLAFARKEVASLIEQLSNEEAPVILVNGVNGALDKFTVTVYAQNETINVNGKDYSNGVKCGEGYKFTISQEDGAQINYATVKIGEKTYKKFLGIEFVSLNAFNSEEDVNKVTSSKFATQADTTVSFNNEREFIIEGKGSLKVTVSPAGNSSYYRNITIDVTSNGNYVDMSKVNNIYLDVQSLADADLSFYLVLIDKNGLSYSADTFMVKAGSKATVTANVLKVGSIDFSNVAKIQILFPEIRQASGFEQPFDIYFDNVYFDLEI